MTLARSHPDSAAARAFSGAGFSVSGLCSIRSKRAFSATNRVAFSVLALLATAACNGQAPGDSLPAASAIDCALAGSSEFTPDCTMERDERDGQSLLILRHPDGGFHRLELGVAGRGIVAADGADEAVVTRGEGTVEVAIGPDRYRLPLAE